MIERTRIRRFCLYIGLAAVVSLGVVCPAAGSKVAALVSRSLGPYQDALGGLQQSTELQVQVYNLEGDMQKGQEVLAGISAENCDVIIPFGTEALSVLNANWPRLPVVYTMVLEPISAAGHRTGGVLMQVPLNEQIARIPKLFPGAKKIGVIYNPYYSKKSIAQARELVDLAGLTLIAISVEKPEEIPSALINLKGANIDILWSVIDPTVAQAGAMAQIVQFSLDNKLPFIALASFQVKAGALACFGVDYRDIGSQTAQLAARMLSTPGWDGRVETPRKVIIFVNEKTEKHLGLDHLADLPEVQVVR